MLAVNPYNPTDQEHHDAKIAVKNGILASMFLRGANDKLYRDLKT